MLVRLPIEASTADTATDTATAIPIGLTRNNRRYALHSDHLGSVRRLSDEEGQTQWQWPYSAFGANPPSGPLKATAKPDKAMTAAPQLLKATSPKLELDLRYPGQMADEHSARCTTTGSGSTSRCWGAIRRPIPSGWREGGIGTAM